MTSNIRSFLLYWMPLVVYVGLIFVLSSLSRVPFNLPIARIDKLLHLVEYAILAALLARAFGSLSWPGAWWGVLLLTVVATVGCGLLDELYQSSVPQRDSDLLDATADALGGILGGALYLLVRMLFDRKIRMAG